MSGHRAHAADDQPGCLTRCVGARRRRVPESGTGCYPRLSRPHRGSRRRNNRPGDIVLIRIGWGPFFCIGYLDGEAGIDVPAARWLTQRDIVAIGCDNMAVEVMTLIENLALDELARDGVVTFGFILV